MLNSLLNDLFKNLTKYDTDDGAGGAGGAGNNDIEFISIKDPVTNEDVSVPKSLEHLVNHLISGTRGQVKKEEKKTHEEMMKKLEDQLRDRDTTNEELLSQLDVIREETMTADEKAKSKIERTLGDNQKAIDTLSGEKDKWKSMFFDHKMFSDIYSSFGDHRLCNPEQVAYLLKKDGKADVKEVYDSKGESTGKYETVLALDIKNKDGDIEEINGTPAELFEKWINQSRNAHHLVNNLQQGGGSQITPVYGDKSLEALKKLPPVERMKVARRQSN